jgi:hypothetical protein
VSTTDKPLAIRLAENLRGLQGRKSSKTACEAADELLRLAEVERERDELRAEVERLTVAALSLGRQVLTAAIDNAPTAAARVPAGEPVAHHWIAPDFAFLFPDEDAARRYLSNIGDSRDPIACYTTPPAAARVPLTPAQQHADELVEAAQALVNSHPHGEAFEKMGCGPRPSILALRIARALLEKIKAAGQEGGAA